MVDGQPLSLQLWDTAGQEDYDRLRPLSYPQTDCFMLCFSLINPQSLRNIRAKWLPEVRLACPQAKVILVGTKCDMHNVPSSVLGKEVPMVDEAEAVATAAQMGGKYVRTSALTQRGLKTAFDTAVRAVITPPTPTPKHSSLAIRLMMHVIAPVLSIMPGNKRARSASNERAATAATARGGVKLQRGYGVARAR